MRRTAAVMSALAGVAFLPACGAAYRLEVRNEVDVPVVVEVVESLPFYDLSVTINHKYKQIDEVTVTRLRSDLAAGGKLVATAKLDEMPESPWVVLISSRGYATIRAPIEGDKLPVRLAVRREQGELVVVPVKR